MREMIRDVIILLTLLVPSYVVSVALFVFGFVIIPSSGSDPSVHVRFGDYSGFTQAASRTQDLVLVVLSVSVLIGSAARFLGARLSTAIWTVFIVLGMYWASLLTIYIAGLLAGVFVLPFR